MGTLGSKLVNYLENPQLRALAEQAGIPIGGPDPEDLAFGTALRRARTPNEVVEVFISDAWDREGTIKVFNRAYSAGAISTNEYKDLVGEGFVRSGDFDT